MTYADPIREHAPKGTGSKRKQFIGKSQSPHCIAFSFMESDQIRHHEGNGGIDEYQKRDREGANREQVREGLPP